MENRLFRSQTDRMLGGVCGGLAKYLKVDLLLVRLFFVVFTMLGGIGPIIYLVLWIVVPEEGKTPVDSKPEVLIAEELKERAGDVRDDFIEAVKKPNQNTARFIGIALVIVGGFLFIKQLHVPWLAWLDSGVAWAALILLAGIALLLRGIRKDQ